MVPCGWDRRNRKDLIEFETPYYEVPVVGLYQGLKPGSLTVLAAKSEDYTTAPQHLLAPGSRIPSVRAGPFTTYTCKRFNKYMSPFDN